MISDPIRFRRLGTAFSFFGAGAFWVAGMVATRWDDGSGTAAYLDSLVVNPVQTQVAAILLHFAFLLLVPAVLGCLGVLTRRGVVLGHVAAVLIVLGGTTLPGLLISDLYDLSIAQRLPRDVGVAVSDGVGEYPAIFVFFVPAVFGTALAVILAIVGLWRAGVAGVAPAVITAVGLGFSQFGPQGLVYAAIGSLVLATGLSLAGLAVARTPDAVWAAGGPAASAVAAAPERPVEAA